LVVTILPHLHNLAASGFCRVKFTKWWRIQASPTGLPSRKQFPAPAVGSDRCRRLLALLAQFLYIK
jgi:hypothetical protein